MDGGYPRGEYVLIPAQNSSSSKLSRNTKYEHPTRVGRGWREEVGQAGGYGIDYSLYASSK
jgi:hypothetical protein